MVMFYAPKKRIMIWLVNYGLVKNPYKIKNFLE